MTRRVYIKATCDLCGSDRVYIEGRGPFPALHAGLKFLSVWPDSLTCEGCGGSGP